MENTNLLKLLENLGLSEHEAKVYLANLSLGPSTILKIARVAETKRTTVYSVVESLKHKGLINIDIKGLKQLFVAANPKKLESMLIARKKQLDNLLPEFSALYNLKGGESTVKYYEGLESVKSVYEGLLNDIKVRDDYLIMGAQDLWYQQDKGFFLKFIEKRAKLNINIRALMIDSIITREHKKIEKNYNEKIKILPKNTKLTTNTVITPQRLVIHQLTPPIMAIVIENQSVIQLHREQFNIIWDSIKN